MRSLGDLLDEAKWGKLTDEEIAYVVQKIKNHEQESGEDLYTLIHILGQSGAKQHRKLVEKFLYYPADPMISRIALMTLCDYWDFAQDYMEDLKAFIKGVAWDEEDFGFVRLIAISIAGEVLRSMPQPELLELLINIFESEDEDREAAYQALARAVGREWEYIFEFKKERQPDPLVLEKARQMLKKQQENNL